MKFLEKETDRFVLTMVEKNICMKEILLTYGFFHEENYNGEESHKEAALAFVTAINQKRGHTKIEYTDRVNFPVNLRKTYSINQLLMQGFIIEGNVFFSTAYDSDKKYTSDYATAFFKLSSSYKGEEKDFIQLNNHIFENRAKLIIYQWNNTWSDYFSYIKKMSGAAYLWTVYDEESKKFTVLGT